ncbi:hypothetical protein HCH_04144 [Hahella chejuensis KCTC 2396]|uniref:Uncharacterized protein n=1 Tax=Hahella chejuensis (strain KCTC 2396) TaxID=349521 RepID=Q2SER9_HAHCH|nr:hypothetical protein HCH_04144 [Hahella chejuensis KCTC 2396]
MIKSILFLMLCILISALAWGFFHLLGQYAFPVMSVMTLVGLLAHRRKRAKAAENSPQ